MLKIKRHLLSTIYNNRLIFSRRRDTFQSKIYRKIYIEIAISDKQNNRNYDNNKTKTNKKYEKETLFSSIHTAYKRK
jgi:hypothetical protein